ncbi:MAG: hypothetical protein HYV09_40530 [Deltaproteobacteria bacterium]|nr:hypothetical protein [Deltaproteobacteria bacterium]
MAHHPNIAKGSTLTAEELGGLVQLANEQTATGAARTLGVDKSVVLRALARQPLRKGSVLLLRQALAAHATATPTEAA